MYDKKYFRFLILTVSAVLLCFSLHISVSSDTFYDDDGYLTFENPSYNSSFAYYNPSSSPVVPENFSGIPSGYVLCAYSVNSNSSRSSWYYCDPAKIPFQCYLNSSGQISFGNSNSSLGLSQLNGFEIVNNISSSGVLSYRSSGSFGFYSFGLNTRLTVFYPVYNSSGDIVRPEGQVNFVLNTAVINYRLVFNSSINSGDASSVSYYMFPASAPISGGSTSSLVSPTPQNQLTTQQQENFLLRGFKLVTYGIDDLIIDLSSSETSLSVSSSARSSNVFNPDSYNLSYEYLGSGRLFPSGDSSITPSGSISIKDILGNHSGVYSYQQLKLVAVCTSENRSFIATFDFNPSAINGGSPVAPSTLEPSVTYPTFDDAQSDFKDFADYMKNLYETQNTNDKRNMNNLLAMLNAMPWTNFVSGGVSAGLDGWTPRLAMELDDIFGNLFDAWTNPSQEDLENLMDDLQDERDNLRSKLAFVDDVKTEVLFVHTSILESGTTPPKFKVPLSAFWSGGSSSSNDAVVIIDFESIPAIVITSIKNIITVFLSLSVVVYIWRTLPATIGNMPSDK